MTRIRPDNLLGILRDRNNDLPPPGPARWGKVARLASGTAIDSKVQGGRQDRLDFVQTGIIADSPIPIAIRVRFSLDGNVYTPEVPAAFGGDMVVTLTEVVDMKSGGVVEKFTLAPGEPMPICAVLARSLNVSVFLDGEDSSIFVQVTAAPTTMIDCADIVGPTNATTTLKPFTDAAVVRIAVTTVMTQLSADARRAYLVITNQSTTRNLFIRLGDGVDATPGSELASIILPPSTFSGYEVLNYTGIVSLVWDGADASGYALATQGLYPP